MSSIGRQTFESRELLCKHCIEKVLVVNDNFELKDLITVKEINKVERYSRDCKGPEGHMRVGFSVGTSADFDDCVIV